MLLEFVQVLTTIGGLSGILAAIYRFLVTKENHKIHHIKITNYVELLTRLPLLKIIIKGLEKVSGLLEMIYGNPRNMANRFQDYFTERAWRASATIACVYLFIIPLVFFDIVLLYAAINNILNEKIDKNLILLVVVVNVILIAIIYMVKKRLKSGFAFKEKTNLTDVLNVSVRLGFAGALVGLVLLVIENYAPIKTVLNKDFYVALIVLFTVAMSYTIIFLIWSYGIWSMAILSIAVVLSLLMVLSGFLTIVSLVPIFDFQILQINLETLYGGNSLGNRYVLVPITIVAVLFFYLFIHSFVKRASTKKVVISILCLCVIPILYYSLIGSIFNNSIFKFYLILFAWTLYVIQCVVIVYTPIFANSLPDLTSISFTRFCINKAIKSENLFRILYYLVLDLVLAFGCVIFSYFIFVIGAYTFSALLDSVDIIAESAGSDFQSSFVGMKYFSGVVTSALYDPISTSSATNSVEINILILVLLSAITGALPTLLNAVILMFYFLGHLVVKLNGTLFVNLHGLLIEESSTGQLIGEWRSVVLIGLLAGTFITLIVYLLDKL